MPYFVRRRARSVSDAALGWPGATYPESAVQPTCDEPATLAGLTVAMDPRTLLSAPASWGPHQIALALALAGLWQIGSPGCAVADLARLVGVRHRDLGLMLPLLAKGPGHIRAEIRGRDVALLSADQRLRRPSLYWRLPVAALSAVADRHTARAWVVFGLAAASAGVGHSVLLPREELSRVLALPSGRDPLKVMAAAIPVLKARFRENELGVEERVGRVRVTGIRSEFRVRWQPPGVFAAAGCEDVAHDGLELGVSRIGSLRGWLQAREERGLDGHLAAVRSLWLSVVQAWGEGLESPLAFYPTDRLERVLRADGPDRAFADLCLALADAAGATARARKPLPFAVHPEDAKRLAAARLARVRGDVSPEVGPVRLVSYKAPAPRPRVSAGWTMRAFRRMSGDWLRPRYRPQDLDLARRVLQALCQLHDSPTPELIAQADRMRGTLAEAVVGSMVQYAYPPYVEVARACREAEVDFDDDLLHRHFLEIVENGEREAFEAAQRKAAQARYAAEYRAWEAEARDITDEDGDCEEYDGAAED